MSPDKNKLAYLIVCCAAALVITAPAGCGGIEDEGPVKARNLATGEIKSFPSAGAVPPDWAPCPDPQCSVPPYIPCGKLGEKVCALHPGCRLKELWCMGQDSVPGGDGTISDSADTPPAPSPVPPTCTYACIDKLPLLCEELSSEKACKARSDCDWAALACAEGCLEPGLCPPCPPAACTTKQPPVCQSFGDEQSCLLRADCEWLQQACPGMPCLPGGPCPACPSSCEPKNPLPPVCPAIAPMPPDCKDGTIVPVYDENGCLVSYECTKSYVACTKLNQDYMAAVKAAKSCNPLSMLTVVQCSAQVEDQLFCPCTTFVNPSNAAFKKLMDLKQQWTAQGCDKQELACPAVECPAPTSASCLGNTAAGTCVDDPS